MSKKKKKTKTLPELSPAQLEIMEVIWQLGEASASQIRSILLKKREVARNTVRTLLERMEEKGWLTHREDGRTFFYSAAQPREVSIGARVLDVIDKTCGGSPEKLVSALLDYRGLSDEELIRVRKMLDQATRKRKNKQKKDS